MKRSVITLSLVVALVLFYPVFSIFAQPVQTPHENPATARGSLNTAALLLSYGNVLNLAARQQYQNAQDTLSELEHADIPEELYYIIDLYQSLYRELLTTLENFEISLDEAANSISSQHVSNAAKQLNQAEVSYHDARLLLEDIAAADNTISTVLDIFALPVASEVKQAYDRLEESQNRLRQLVNELNHLRESLVDQNQTQAIKLLPTELSLSTTPKLVFVGDSITTRGRLSSDNTPLPQRKLSLLVNNKPLRSITTDLYGSYEAEITLPNEYLPNLTLTAEYVSSGTDASTYQSINSQPVPVIFYPISLEISTPGNVHPGLPFTISGLAISTGANTDHPLKVLLDNKQLAEKTIPWEFSFGVTLPPETSAGEHILTMLVPPQERYAGTLANLTLNISRLPIQADIQTSQLVIIPGQARISGQIYDETGPLQGASISLNFKDYSKKIRTLDNGSFSTMLDAPIDLFSVGPQEITITVEPVEPWYAPLEVKRQIFNISPANTGIMLAAIISLGIVLYKRSRIRPEASEVAPTPQTRDFPAVTSAPGDKPKPIKVKDRILWAYTSALEAVQMTTSIPITPHTTLRESLEASTHLLTSAVKPFAELTTMAEIALYSTRRLDKDSARRAEQLATAIREELQSGTA